MATLRVSQLRKSFEQELALDSISFTLDEGEILCLLGPSGCGKTTLLRLIAGLEMPDSGTIHFGDNDLSAVPPHRRDFGLMFQEFALFPHKNVAENVAFGLQMKQAAETESRVKAMLDLVGLADFETRDVSSLSGGERQRVALARSLAPKPRLLMLDEPLGALDRSLREHLMLEIRQILKDVGLTAIYVTHDQTEAFAIADRIIVMNRGRIEQEDTPEKVYYQPATPFVARFLGFSNLLAAVSKGPDQIESNLGVWSVLPHDIADGEAITALIRPEAASLRAGSSQAIKIEGVLESRLFRGRFYQLTLDVMGLKFTFEIALANPPPLGHPLTLWLDPGAIRLLRTVEDINQ